MSRFDLSGEFQIGSDHFQWIAKYYAGFADADADFRGILARISLVGGKTRELFIEFHPHDYPSKRPPEGPFEERLIEYTQKAIDQGWRPDSRGKPFRIEAEKLRG